MSEFGIFESGFYKGGVKKIAVGMSSSRSFDRYSPQLMR